MSVEEEASERKAVSGKECCIIPLGVRGTGHVTVFTQHIRRCTNCTAIAVPLKIVHNGFIVCIHWPEIFICLTLINYCVEEYIFEFQVFTGVDKAVFRVSSDPSTAITRQACLATPWRA